MHGPLPKPVKQKHDFGGSAGMHGHWQLQLKGTSNMPARITPEAS